MNQTWMRSALVFVGSAAIALALAALDVFSFSIAFSAIVGAGCAAAAGVWWQRRAGRQ